MAVRISVGGDNFERLRSNGSYYVDKTELLYELVQKQDNLVTLFTRPRRFGKTLTMSMMECFFDIRRDSRDLFAGLDITKHEDFCREWMNQYPVLFVSFKDAAGLRRRPVANCGEAVCRRSVWLPDDSALPRGVL